MKNISIILNIVLFVAVGVLYFFHFSGSGRSVAAGLSSSGSSIDSKIAYIRTDSLMLNYEFVKTGQKQFQEKGEKLNQEYRNRAIGLQGEIDNYQRSRGNLTISQDRALAEDLTKKQQNLQLYQQSLQQDMMEEESKMTQEIYDRLTSFLKKYSEEKGIEVVIKFDPTSDMLYGNIGLDVTKDVVNGLNAEYKAEQSGGKGKADSTVVK
jgi:outer membrane protein